jgi:hypothetical protein
MPTRDSLLLAPPGGMGVVVLEGIGVVERDAELSFESFSAEHERMA